MAKKPTLTVSCCEVSSAANTACRYIVNIHNKVNSNAMHFFTPEIIIVLLLSVCLSVCLSVKYISLYISLSTTGLIKFHCCIKSIYYFSMTCVSIPMLDFILLIVSSIIFISTSFETCTFIL